jgi:hypothetical protein
MLVPLREGKPTDLYKWGATSRERCVLGVRGLRKVVPLDRGQIGTSRSVTSEVGQTQGQKEHFNTCKKYEQGWA